MDGNPNYYTRRDVLILARVIDPVVWINIPEGHEPLSHQFQQTERSISTAAKVLMAGYRNCTHEQH